MSSPEIHQLVHAHIIHIAFCIAASAAHMNAGDASRNGQTHLQEALLEHIHHLGVCIPLPGVQYAIHLPIKNSTINASAFTAEKNADRLLIRRLTTAQGLRTGLSI